MNKYLLYAVSVGVFALYIFGAIVSFYGLYGIAPWLKMPEMVYWTFPLAVDLAIILYKVAEVVQKRNDAPRKKVRKAIFGSIAFTTVSSIGNVIHVANDPDPSTLRLWGGIFFAGLMPWAVYLSASVLTDLIVQPARIVPDSMPETDFMRYVEEDAAQGAAGSHVDVEGMHDVDDLAYATQPQAEYPPVPLPTSADATVGGFSLVKDIRPFPSAWGGDSDARN